MPRQPRKPHTPAAVENAPAKADPDPDFAPESIEGMDEWKSTYEAYEARWHAESAEAREKAHTTRKRIEEERAATQKVELDKTSAQRTVGEAKQKEQERKDRLQSELEDRAKSSNERRDTLDEEEKVPEVWEMVTGGDEHEHDGSEVVTDARGVMDADITAGQAGMSTSGRGRPSVKQVRLLLRAKATVNVCRQHMTQRLQMSPSHLPCKTRNPPNRTLSRPSQRPSHVCQLPRKRGKTSPNLHLPPRTSHLRPPAQDHLLTRWGAFLEEALRWMKPCQIHKPKISPPWASLKKMWTRQVPHLNRNDAMNDHTLIHRLSPLHSRFHFSLHPHTLPCPEWSRS